MISLRDFHGEPSISSAQRRARLSALAIVAAVCATSVAASQSQAERARGGTGTRTPRADNASRRMPGASSTTAQVVVPTQPDDPAARRLFLDSYCVGCHNERQKATFANLALDAIDVQQLGPNAGTWEKVIKKLSVGAMPPVGSRRPGADAYAEF